MWPIIAVDGYPADGFVWDSNLGWWCTTQGVVSEPSAASQRASASWQNSMKIGEQWEILILWAIEHEDKYLEGERGRHHPRPRLVQ